MGTVGIQLKGTDAHANVLSLNLLDNRPWKDDAGQNDINQGSSRVNFLQQAMLEQVNFSVEDEDVEMEEVTEEVTKSSKRKKQKVNVYQFFQDMEKIGLRPLDSQ